MAPSIEAPVLFLRSGIGDQLREKVSEVARRDGEGPIRDAVTQASTELGTRSPLAGSMR